MNKELHIRAWPPLNDEPTSKANRLWWLTARRNILIAEALETAREIEQLKNPDRPFVLSLGFKVERPLHHRGENE